MEGFAIQFVGELKFDIMGRRLHDPGNDAMRKLSLAVLLAAAVFAGEEAVRADPLMGKKAEDWVELLGSEKFEEREEASRRLVAAGDASEGALKKVLDPSDQEVRVRARLAVSAIVSVS